MTKLINRHILVSGQVQGVGYRAFAQREAQKLSIKGMARNLADGRVEILASSNNEHLLQQFISRLLEGPKLAQIDAVQAKDIAVTTEVEGFLIIEDGISPWYSA